MALPDAVVLKRHNFRYSKGGDNDEKQFSLLAQVLAEYTESYETKGTAPVKIAPNAVNSLAFEVRVAATRRSPPVLCRSVVRSVERERAT